MGSVLVLSTRLYEIYIIVSFWIGLQGYRVFVFRFMFYHFFFSFFPGRPLSPLLCEGLVGDMVAELLVGSTGELPAVKVDECTFASNACFSRATYVFTVTFNMTPVPGPRMPRRVATTS